MRRLIFSIALAVLPLLATRAEAGDSVAADTSQVWLSRYDKRVHRMRHHWENLIPTQFIMQNAGNMGFLSAGIGWDYGRRAQWETHLLFGFIPSYKSPHARVTTTLKETYIPWSISLNERFAVEPLSAGIYLNTVYGSDFWSSQPTRYPDKYYEALSTKVRINVFVGQRVTLTIPHAQRKWVKGITAFYEVSTCDLYLRALLGDNSVSFWNIIGLSLGVKMQVF